MKKTNKKGFTIVELVIVIAVIAILAAVLIPTFSGVVEKAQKSAAMQEARNANTAYIASLDLSTVSFSDLDYYVQSGDYYFTVTDGQLDADTNHAVKGTAAASNAFGVLNAETLAYTEKTTTTSNP